MKHYKVDQERQTEEAQKSLKEMQIKLSAKENELLQKGDELESLRQKIVSLEKKQFASDRTTTSNYEKELDSLRAEVPQINLKVRKKYPIGSMNTCYYWIFEFVLLLSYSISISV